jgi:hypothetical protein
MRIDGRRVADDDLSGTIFTGNHGQATTSNGTYEATVRGRGGVASRTAERQAGQTWG